MYYRATGMCFWSKDRIVQSIHYPYIKWILTSSTCHTQKWILDRLYHLNVKGKIITYLEDDGEHLHDLGVGKHLLNRTQEVLSRKEKYWLTERH